MNTKTILLASGANPFATGMMRGMGLGRATFAPDFDSGSGGDNGGGNDGGAGTGESTGDNGGTGFNADAFWTDPVEETPGGTQTGNNDSGGGQQQQTQQSEGQLFAQKLANLSFGDVFTEADMRKMADDGDLTGINAAINTQLKQAAHQSVVLTAELMQKNNAAMESRFRAILSEVLGGEKNEDTLLKEFPAAADPRARPMIQQVFNQALKHTKGNRPQAVIQAKEMLKIMGSVAGADLGITDAPRGPGDQDYNTQGSKSLVDSLLQRN